MMWKRLFGVTLLLVLASNLCWAQQWDFPVLGSDVYPLRWGNVEGSADLVPSPSVLGLPVCAKKGSTLGLAIRWNGTAGALMGWRPVKVVFESAVTGAVIWQHLWQGGGDWLPPDVVYLLPALPGYVEYARLWSEGQLLVRTGFPWQPLGVLQYSTRSNPSEVFVVLDAPKAPMNPAWVSVLRYSCVWAREAVSPTRAAELLTKELWMRGTYITGAAVQQLQACTRNHTDGGEDFHLKMFLGSYGWLPLRGQCNDLADFLVCLVTSAGAYPLRSQRSYSLGTAYSGEPNGNGWRIYTQQIDPAGAPPLTSLGVSHHQFAVYDNMIWDPSYGFVSSVSGIEIAVGWQRDSRYKQALIRYYIYFLDGQQSGSPILPGSPSEPWNPTPAAGFVPNVTTIEPISDR